MTHRFLALPLGIVALAATACSEPTEPVDGKQLGVIAFYSEPVVVQAPDTVQVGVPFDVGVRTYGSPCLRNDGTEVRMTGGGLEVWPYDTNIHDGEIACIDILEIFDHQATVTLHEPGPVEIEFKGRELPGDSVVSVVRSVVVE